MDSVEAFVGRTFAEPGAHDAAEWLLARVSLAALWEMLAREADGAHVDMLLRAVDEAAFSPAARRQLAARDEEAERAVRAAVELLARADDTRKTSAACKFVAEVVAPTGAPSGDAVPLLLSLVDEAGEQLAERASEALAALCARAEDAARVFGGLSSDTSWVSVPGVRRITLALRCGTLSEAATAQWVASGAGEVIRGLAVVLRRGGSYPLEALVLLDALPQLARTDAGCALLCAAREEDPDVLGAVLRGLVLSESDEVDVSLRESGAVALLRCMAEGGRTWLRSIASGREGTVVAVEEEGWFARSGAWQLRERWWIEVVEAVARLCDESPSSTVSLLCIELASVLRSDPVALASFLLRCPLPSTAPPLTWGSEAWKNAVERFLPPSSSSASSSSASSSSSGGGSGARKGSGAARLVRAWGELCASGDADERCAGLHALGGALRGGSVPPGEELRLPARLLVLHSISPALSLHHLLFLTLQAAAPARPIVRVALAAGQKPMPEERHAAFDLFEALAGQHKPWALALLADTPGAVAFVLNRDEAALEDSIDLANARFAVLQAAARSPHVADVWGAAQAAAIGRSLSQGPLLSIPRPHLSDRGAF